VIERGRVKEIVRSRDSDVVIERQAERGRVEK